MISLLAVLRGGRGGQLERVQRGACVAFAAHREEAQRLLGNASPSLSLRDRAGEHRLELLDAQLLQRVDAQPREQRAVDLERRVLGRRADQRHEPLLDRRQQRVLLGLVEAVDLVEEQDRGCAAGLAPVARALDHGAHLGTSRRDGAQLLERRTPELSATMRASVVLPEPGGP